MRVDGRGVCVTSSMRDATDFMIKVVEEPVPVNHRCLVITEPGLQRYLYFDTLIGRLAFGKPNTRNGLVWIDSPIPDTPFHTIALAGSLRKPFLRLGIEGQFELNTHGGGRSWWMFIEVRGEGE